MTISYWESRFQIMGSPPSATEQEKCENAKRVLRASVDADPILGSRPIRIVRQGSYRNHTNVRQESDVDLALVCSQTVYFELPSGLTAEMLGFTPIVYQYPDFKNDVERALSRKFQNGALVRGDKAFDIKANTYRVEADVAVFFDYRIYRPDRSFVEGIVLFKDSGGQVVNWPEQHYRNGVAKNDATRRRYKQVVRVLKSLRYELLDQGNVHARDVIGFALECAAWNVPDSVYGHSTLYDDVKAVIREAYAAATTPARANTLTEVNDIKLLYGSQQKWTADGMAAFLKEAYAHVGFS